MADNEEKKNNGDESGKSVTALEYVVAALGCVLVFGSIAFMVYTEVVASDKPPMLNVAVKKVERLDSGYLVTFDVKNEGEYAAASATVKGELISDGKAKETRTTTVAYVPAKSTRSGGLFFSSDPDEHKLEINAMGYSEP